MSETLGDLLGRVSAAGLCSLTPGLTEAEFRSIERRFHIQFTADHHALLAAGVPRGPRWPDWRGDEIRLRSVLGAPVRFLLSDVRDGFWIDAWGYRPRDPREAERTASRNLAGAPRLAPLHGNAYVAPTRVLSFFGADVRIESASIAGYLTSLLEPAEAPSTPYWVDLYAPPPAEEAEYDPLPTPPFPPDPNVRAPSITGRRAPEHVFADLRLAAQPHAGKLADGTLLWTAAIPAGTDSARLWESLRSQYPETGLWPLLITEFTLHRTGADGGVPDTQSLAPLSPRGLLHSELDGQAWLAARFAEIDSEIDRYNTGPLPVDRREWRELWHRYGAEFTQIALVPTPAPWFVPGLLQWSGAANYDVGGVDHATMLRRWSGRWGAELVALDQETLFVRVAAPPDPTVRLDPALECYLYCPDSVLQDAGSLDSLAAWCLHPVWRLWWD